MILLDKAQRRRTIKSCCSAARLAARDESVGGQYEHNQTTNQTVSAAAAKELEVVETIALYITALNAWRKCENQIDLAAKQNAELLEAWKKIARVPGRTRPHMLDLVSNALNRYATRRRAQLTWFRAEPPPVPGQGRASSTANAADGAATIVKQTVDRLRRRRPHWFGCPDWWPSKRPSNCFTCRSGHADHSSAASMA